MSDEQPFEAGSRRRRREIREAKEREQSAQRERESVVRRLSSTSTAVDSPTLFDQEATRQNSQGPRASPAPTQASPASTSPKGPAGNLTGHLGSPNRSTSSTRAEPANRAEPADHPEVNHPEVNRNDSTPSPKTRRIDQEDSSSPLQSRPASIPATAPAMPFEDVVAPQSPSSPDMAEHNGSYHQHDLDGTEFYHIDEELEPDHLHLEHEPFGDYGEVEWDSDYEGLVENDENGVPVVVGASGFGRGYQTVTPVEGRVNRSVYKRRQAKRRRRNITLTFALAGFAALMIGFVIVVQSLLGGDDGPYDYEVQAGDTIGFEVVQGDGLENVTNRLVEQEIVASRGAFQNVLAELDSDLTLHPGQFEMREQMPAADAAAALFADGEATHYFGIAAGWRVEEALEAIASGTGINLQELEALNEDPQQFGLPDEAESLEGYLAVGEYRPDLDVTAEEVIEMAVAPTFELLDEFGVTDEDEQWRTVIISSLIVAEANHSEPDDYAIIAGAIVNRLDPDNTETDGLLQIDAAVNYGLGLSGDLHFPEEERLNPDNPFNTYVHQGLPPGPIAAPTPAVLEAAANPADTDYFYWVTVNVETGETRFNETLAEHEQDVEVFNEYCRENEGVCSPAEVEAAEEELEE